MKIITIIGFILCSFSMLDAERLKVLHITLHEGCMNDFKEVARELDVDLTSWFVQHLPKDFWEGQSVGNEIYNIGPRRARRVWDRHKDFFNQFDLVITSDTAPLSRIFLQNGWKKPLIIWICNRFDYADGYGGEDRFPDPAYYDLFRAATQMPNVKIIPYTIYESVYAQRKGIDIGDRVIKPLGTSGWTFGDSKWSVGDQIKNDTILLFPRLSQESSQRILQECRSRAINAWSGAFNGPDDLASFKGVIYFPYQLSNLVLFEGIQRGTLFFVPTIDFINHNGFARENHHAIQWCEWYAPEYKEALIYFSSWDDLKAKIDAINYDEQREKIKAIGAQHRANTLAKWRSVFHELTGRL